MGSRSTAAHGAATWHYTPPNATNKVGRATPPPLPYGIEGEDYALNVGTYTRSVVTNVGSNASSSSSDGGTAAAQVDESSRRSRLYFDLGLRLLFAYQHEQACKLFLACLAESPDCALAHGLVALCHGPNYNFKGEAYYDSTDHPEQLYLDEIVNRAAAGRAGAGNGNGNGGGDGSSSADGAEGQMMTAQIAALDEMMNVFPSQQVATKHARAAVDKVEQLARKAKGRKRSASAANVAASGPSGDVVDAGLGNVAAPSQGVGHDDNIRRNGSVDGDDDESTSRSQCSSVVMDDAPDANDGNSGVVHIVMEDADDHGTRGGQDGPTAAAPQSPMHSSSQPISETEADILRAIGVLCAHPGVDPALAMDTVGRPYANAMREVYRKHPNDAEVAYFFAESLMVLNAWSLYEYPTGRPLTPDVFEIRDVLERSLRKHPDHAGLCHLYVHLSEMSDNPAMALSACAPLRTRFPDAGHLVHMATHIDVLIGDYDSCVRWNAKAIDADQKAMLLFPDTAGTVSFYFGYIVHNYHMLVYGCILGAFEKKAMKIAEELNKYLSEDVFLQNPDLTAYLESYAALDVHVLVRFGRWREILQLAPPLHPQIMLYRSASLRYARALAFANLGNIEAAKAESRAFDVHRTDPEAENRILHNNTVAALLAVDATMIRGEIAYNEGRYEAAFKLLRRAVQLQDKLHYDEPWGKMQPIRHALGGLLLEKGRISEAEEVFRADLNFHPKNPWSLRGLIDCLGRKLKQADGGKACCASGTIDKIRVSAEGTGIVTEMKDLEVLFQEQRKSEFADYEISKSCACCKKELQ